MESSCLFKIVTSTNDLPIDWNALATSNIFLAREYLAVLEQSKPKNMDCFFISFYKNDKLVGIALAQFLDLNKLESFGERDKCVKTAVRNFIFKNFCSHVLFIGNNMLTGQNAFSFSDEIEIEKGIELLRQAELEIKLILKKRGKKVHLTTYKDFDKTEINHFPEKEFEPFYQFSTQPNMVFKVSENWLTFDDYIASLSKKYRDQYKRCRKKAEGIEKRKMNLEEIIAQEDTIYELYFHVAKNAPFNTFFLAKNHFGVMKSQLKDKFLFYGYFENEKLIGFNTLIKNGSQMDTYFLGYDETIQREKMLYLNMLYDMIAYSINKGFKEIIFARTALEIKSSVGAKPEEMVGYIQHSNGLINRKMEQLFCYLEPETEWKERNPFK
ncbi:peptidogalycan biosysnthesis protein [Flavobacterium azooxidireducens]|uniref:Peptidogalycan biosysnthesis protein n=1 Tax=Flavobacterium azooxidireducens TaxID=1871076 RepID=A0ABY4KGE3_9FLAO|nr:peptidogalycan biosysnthesis protein [Flavobacterium azooxidireducens]UPQ79869.1 peptidogalycan biosysnthesis protein [Flavobacterium azooxidireducens]